jgi:hypothetical protein
MRSLITWIIALITFILVGYFFIHHLSLILYDKTSHEHKYKIIHDKEKTNTIKNLKFWQKLKMIYENVLNLIRSNSLFDLFWPD